MTSTLHFLRHGQTEQSRQNVFCGSGLDPELTEHGRQMAQAFADAYRDVAWKAVYTSTLARTLTTAAPLCAAIGQKPQPRAELVEIGYGQWEGKTADEVNRNYHDDYVRWTADPAWNPPTGGETALAIARRGMLLVEEIRSAHPEGDVLIVSHKATIRIILCALLGIDVGRFRFRLGCPVASVSRVEFGAHGPLLKALADRSHLGQALRDLPGT